MTPEDIAALMARAYRHQEPWRAVDVAAMLDRPVSRLLTAPGAVLIAQVVADEAEILALATDPGTQRRGVARGLLARFHDDAAADGVTRAVLDVAEDNEPARTLYASAGYVETARRHRYYARRDGTRADALLMARALPAG
ncbi:ribosomal-protein-alanine N-acetyltransferase [Roseivivax jejudonensis]|uniref:Ribosomal-protein-alanine N-acetyltransferase n=1 Tax=Roseivivax jejudonensis TaxID=1529041 RepID=A0A1X6YC36_9RHOB|nr:GNAT family N-acetyltransferase [Roseivivax jejudonensis]SLN15065.1 ribosomal-protein-alanine N-acetyltransferase [Roseivivax jejudonensis]